MPAIGRLAVQRAKYHSRLFQRIDALEQRSHIEGRLAGALVRDVRPSRQQQNGQYVLGALRAAHNVFADRAPTELMARLSDGLEHPQAAPSHGIEHRGRPLIAREQIAKLHQPLGGRQLRPLGVAQSLSNHLIVNSGMLGDIQGGQMETKRAHAPQESAHEEIARVPAAILQ